MACHSPIKAINQSITVKAANAVQSLNRDSHSKIKASLLGAHIDLNRAKTATGSVAEISAQKSKQTKNGTSNQTSGSKKYNAHPIKNIAIASPITAKKKIDFQFFRSSL